MKPSGTGLFISTVVIIALIAIGYLVWASIYDPVLTDMDKCKSYYRVFSCSLQPDRSAFTLPKGTQI